MPYEKYQADEDSMPIDRIEEVYDYSGDSGFDIEDYLAFWAKVLIKETNRELNGHEAQIELVHSELEKALTQLKIAKVILSDLFPNKQIEEITDQQIAYLKNAKHVYDALP